MRCNRGDGKTNSSEPGLKMKKMITKTLTFVEERAILSVLCRYLDDQHDAEQALVDIELKVWKAREQKKYLTIGYVAQVAENHCIDLLRRKAIQTSALEVLDYIDGKSDTSLGEIRHLKVDVESALFQLLPAEQAIIATMHFEGCSVQVIAKSMSLTEGKVRYRLKTAINSLLRSKDALRVIFGLD